MPFLFFPPWLFLLVVQPFGHIPADEFVRLQFQMKDTLGEINLFQKMWLKWLFWALWWLWMLNNKGSLKEMGWRIAVIFFYSPPIIYYKWAKNLLLCGRAHPPIKSTGFPHAFGAKNRQYSLPPIGFCIEFLIGYKYAVQKPARQRKMKG
jgi:hypothetical protein